MDRNLLEISDGKLYELNDMVKVGCHDCAGCSECCRDMGQSVLLDPYDVFLLTKNLEMTFEELMQEHVELHMEEGLILPNLKMAVDGNAGIPACTFLNEQGRCSIHAFRPGICRLFPLGRNYTPDHLNYFLLVHECPAQNKTKMKVSKWIDSERVRDYQKFLLDWHNLTKQMREEVAACMDEDAQCRKMMMMFLTLFYQKPYISDDFFAEFYERAGIF